MQDMSVPLVELRNVSKSYSTGGFSTVEVLKNINLIVHDGESIAIVGPSGSGKTTLLNIIGILDVPDEGTLLFRGKPISYGSDVECAHFRNQNIGFVFQMHCLLPQCTVLENVLLPAVPCRRARVAEERAQYLLERVGLSRMADYRPSQLSAGQRQRVALARALLNKPPLLLADEPTGSLDRESALSLMRLLIEVNREENTALVVVTHWMELAHGMQKVFVLSGGKLNAV
jgi:ABC-type lipoprotein export system ATPase subunit